MLYLREETAKSRRFLSWWLIGPRLRKIMGVDVIRVADMAASGCNSNKAKLGKLVYVMFC